MRKKLKATEVKSIVIGLRLSIKDMRTLKRLAKTHTKGNVANLIRQGMAKAYST